MKPVAADIFVGMHDLVNVRKGVLCASKDTLKILQGYEQYKRLRTEKLQYVLKLYRTLSEISSLNKKLKSSLPQISVHSVQETIGVHHTVVDVPEHVAPKPAKSKLDLLEEELNAIESRLSALG